MESPLNMGFLFWVLRLQFRGERLSVPICKGYGRKWVRGMFFLRGSDFYSVPVTTHFQGGGSFLQGVSTLSQGTYLFFTKGRNCFNEGRNGVDILKNA